MSNAEPNSSASSTATATTPATTEPAVTAAPPAADAANAPAPATQEGLQSATPETEAKPADTAEEAKQPEGAPEAYAEYTVPDDMKQNVTANQDATARFNTLAKSLNLTQAQAQEMVNLHVDMLRGQMKAWDDMNAKWQEKIKADKEFGGDNFEKTKNAADTVLKNFGASDPDVAEFVTMFRAGNHPGFIKLMARIGNQFTNSGFPGSASAAPPPPATAMDALKNALYS